MRVVAERFAPSSESIPHQKEQPRKSSVENRLEQQVVAMMLQYPEILPEVEKSNVLEHFMDNTLLFIGQLILAASARGRKGGVEFDVHG